MHMCNILSWILRWSLLLCCARSDQKLPEASDGSGSNNNNNNNNSNYNNRAAVLQPWSTPLLAWRSSPSIRQALAELARQLEASEPSVNASNRGGWQSGNNLHLRKLDAIEGLLQEIAEATRYYFATGLKQPGNPHVTVKVVGLWANVNRLGDYNVRHKHPAALLAGVYYVTGSSGASLVFEDPRPQTNVLDAYELFGMGSPKRIQPSAGAILLFPGWLEHQVEAQYSSHPRVSFSFNVMAKVTS
ncbi:unnamed protein product [Polarella glacialis]|uniref:Fe2OG dioxygenase domain-containing protein n=1 Tax=Polarella glacialis TaxID=89957 RepID=A0A813HG82_POLGL|nr:unnamed protein product [Polarella glacialis]